MNKEPIEIYVEVSPVSATHYINDNHLRIPVKKQSKIILSQEEWDENKKEIQVIRDAAIRQSNIATDRLNEMYEKIQRLTKLISIAWYDGYNKANEKELAYDLLQNFKTENGLSTD